MKHAKAIIAVAVVVLVTGCLTDKPSPGPDALATATNSSTPTPTEPLDETVSNVPQRFLLSQCTGFVGVSAPLPRALGPGQRPQGWEPTNPSEPVGYVPVSGYECNRINLGPYERGPVRIVWDGHTNADFPEACMAGKDATTLGLLVNVIMVDDAEIALHLREAYGLPALHSSIDINSQGVGNLRQLTWAWGNDTKSRMEFVDDGTADSYGRNERFFWEKDSGIGALDLVHDREASAVTDRVGYGKMESPMLSADFGGGVFSGTVNYVSRMETEATFHSYRDLGCQVEVNPPS